MKLRCLPVLSASLAAGARDAVASNWMEPIGRVIVLHTTIFQALFDRREGAKQFSWEDFSDSGRSFVGL